MIKLELAGKCKDCAEAELDQTAEENKAAVVEAWGKRVSE